MYIICACNKGTVCIGKVMECSYLIKTNLIKRNMFVSQ